MTDITDLYYAVTASDVPAVATLLAQGADPNEADEDEEETALHKAVRIIPDPDSDDATLVLSQILSLLLLHGADIHRRNAFGRTPLDIAYQVANGVAVRALHEAGASLVDLTQGVTAEEAAAAHLSLEVLLGNATSVEALLRNGLDVNSRDRYGRTALHAAAESGETALADTLLRCGADLMAREDAYGDNGVVYPRQGMTPLHLAAHRGNEAIVHLLLAQGADIEADSGREDNVSPLQCAVFMQGGKQSHRTIQALLDHGADPLERPSDRNEKYKECALCIAAWIGTPETVALLLAHCGDRLNKEDLQKAMRAAIEDNGHQNLPLLWEAGQHLSPPLTLLDVLPHIDSAGLRILLEDVPDLNVQETSPETGETPLLWIARHVEETTDPDRWWDVPYHEESITLLLQHGADTTATDHQGESPLSVARQRGIQRSVESMEWFLAQGQNAPFIRRPR